MKGGGYRHHWVSLPQQAPDELEEDVRAVMPPRQHQWESVASLGPPRHVPGVPISRTGSSVLPSRWTPRCSARISLGRGRGSPASGLTPRRGPAAPLRSLCFTRGDPPRPRLISGPAARWARAAHRRAGPAWRPPIHSTRLPYGLVTRGGRGTRAHPFPPTGAGGPAMPAGDTLQGTDCTRARLIGGSCPTNGPLPPLRTPGAGELGQSIGWPEGFSVVTVTGSARTGRSACSTVILA